MVVHLAHFWVGTKIAVYGGGEHDTYQEMLRVFSNPINVALYVVGVISLAYHLLHGFSSAFQTFGLNHKKYTPVIQSIGVVYTVVVCALFASMPILIFAGVIS